MGTTEEVIQYISRYGAILIFALLYLEQLNFPGLSATLILPAIGIFIAKTDNSFLWIFIVSLSAAISGSITLYLIGYWIGQPILDWIKKKFPKSEKRIDKVLEYLEKYGSKGALICRFIPGIRTIISLISGAVRENFYQFFIYSSLGIALWNLGLILFGYLTTITFFGK